MRGMKRHALDALSLLFGVIFALLGVFVVVTSTGLDELGIGRIWPIPVIALGLVMLLLALGWEREPPEPESAPSSQSDDGRPDA